MMPRPITRSPGTRTSSKDTRQRQVESLAAEFALLAQRRARQAHQIELLEQQLHAAVSGMTKLQRRLSWLVQQMDALDPSLRPALESAPASAPPLPAPPPPTARPTRYAPSRLAPAPLSPAELPLPAPQAGRKWAALQGAAGPRPQAGKWRG
jgi:hypothetical protein